MINSKNIDLNNKVVLVTGGTGSFGQKFVLHLLNNFNLKKLIIFSRDEQKQVEMQFSPLFKGKKELRFFIGDIRDVNRLKMAMRGVDYVVHAAALKHVPVAEYNPFECIHTNVLGAENVVTASLENGIKGVIALSTDKAVNPINIYGASKLAADKIFVAANAFAGDVQTHFSIVRYGNVLGSRGSIVPMFKKLVEDGEKSLPITDERMTRFWITMEQGIGFVLSSMGLQKGGEIFVPKAPSMKIKDLISAFAPGMPTHTIGIRPGEKIHEVLVTEDDTSDILDIGDRYIITPQYDPSITKEYIKDGATLIKGGFKYSSDNNNEWLDNKAFSELLKKSEL
ncbi:MAG: UDP-N-acetylglucosamine 4,6-dehydratase (inverting) [Legionellales bacterium]|nr:UDP-N-acetylglucosamine 4,6-dehydratase (inverting) [Legionellales bacterium]